VDRRPDRAVAARCSAYAAAHRRCDRSRWNRGRRRNRHHAAGVDADDRGWVLADVSGQYAPTDWAKRAVDLYYQLHADRIVAEINYGGQMVEATIRAIDQNVAYRAVTASRGKVARAEPIAALYSKTECITLAASRSSKTR
jgi:hypothetical protein